MNAAFAPDEWASLLCQLKAVGSAPVPSRLVPGELLTAKKSRTCLAWSDDGRYVLKRYADAGRAEHEASVMARLRAAGLAVPEPVASGEFVLLRAFVEGSPLKVRGGFDFGARCVQLARWLRRCHELGAAAAGRPHGTESLAGSDSPDSPNSPNSPAGPGCSSAAATWLVGDMNLGNFVVGEADNLIWGIDFGDTRRGDPYDDVGEGVMRILIRPPAFTALSWETAVRFVDAYAGNGVDGIAEARELVIPAAQRAFVQMAVWRNGDEEMLRAAEGLPAAWRRVEGLRDPAGGGGLTSGSLQRPIGPPLGRTNCEPTQP